MSPKKVSNIKSVNWIEVERTIFSMSIKNKENLQRKEIISSMS